MTYKILVGVYGDAISTLEFDPTAKSLNLKVTSDSTVSPNPSWIAEGKGGLYSISEADPGLVTQLQRDGDGVKETSKKETGGGPAHVLVTSEGDVVVSNVSPFLGAARRTFVRLPSLPSLNQATQMSEAGKAPLLTGSSMSAAACSGTTRTFPFPTLTRARRHRTRSARTRLTLTTLLSTTGACTSVTSAVTRCGFLRTARSRTP